MKINKIAFTLFGRDIAWYGIIIMLGIVAGVLYVLYRAKHNEGISTDDILDLAICSIISAIVGARLYYVATSFGDFVGDSVGETLYNCIAIWEGGIAIYGAIIGGGIAAFIFAKVKKLKFTQLFDMMAPAVMLGQIIGRWGNFMNAEAYGTVTTLPWRMGIRADGSALTSYVHPTFLYESLWNLAGFILINLFYRKKKFNGQIFLLYITWYGFGRMFVEGLRTDSLYVGPFRISQLIGFASFVAGIIMLAVFGIRAQSAKNPENAVPDADSEKEAQLDELVSETDSAAGTDPAVNSGSAENSDSAADADPAADDVGEAEASDAVEGVTEPDTNESGEESNTDEGGAEPEPEKADEPAEEVKPEEPDKTETQDN